MSAPARAGVTGPVRSIAGLVQLLELALEMVRVDGRVSTRRPEVAGNLDGLRRYAARIDGGVPAVVESHLSEAHRLFLRHPHGAVDDVIALLTSAAAHLGARSGKFAGTTDEGGA